MDEEQEPQKEPEKLEQAADEAKAKMRKFLMSKNIVERYKLLRENFSLILLKKICEWAIPEEDYEICSSVQQVMANNLATFDIQFVYEGLETNKAGVVIFKGEDGIFYYHADYVLHDQFEGAILNLYNNIGIWTSDWPANEPTLFKPIGEAIEDYEKQNSLKNIAAS